MYAWELFGELRRGPDRLLEVVADADCGGHDAVVGVEAIRIYTWAGADLMLEVFWDAGAVDIEDCVEGLGNAEGVDDTE